MELFLFRHAQSANNAKPESQRVPDPGLTELGQEQARCLAEQVGSIGLTRLITSPFLRTLLTADHIHTETRLVPEVRIDLHEQGGCYSGYLPSKKIGQPGLSRSEISARFPTFGIETALDGDGWWRSQPHETREAASVRANELLERLQAEFKGSSERVGLVMHADIKLLVLEHLDATPIDRPHNASITHIARSRGGLKLIAYNLVDHLPNGLVTA